jgi:hypothetical protein
MDAANLRDRNVVPPEVDHVRERLARHEQPHRRDEQRACEESEGPKPERDPLRTRNGARTISATLG